MTSASAILLTASVCMSRRSLTPAVAVAISDVVVISPSYPGGLIPAEIRCNAAISAMVNISRRPAVAAAPAVIEDHAGE